MFLQSCDNMHTGRYTVQRSCVWLLL